MTWTDVTSPPVLFLPSQPLDEVAAAVERARCALVRAQNVEWDSVAATRYHAHLDSAAGALSRLAQLVGDCQDEWVRARSVARAWGQL